MNENDLVVNWLVLEYIDSRCMIVVLILNFYASQVSKELFKLFWHILRFEKNPTFAGLYFLFSVIKHMCFRYNA